MRSLVSYRVKHSKRDSISTRAMYYSLFKLSNPSMKGLRKFYFLDSGDFIYQKRGRAFHPISKHWEVAEFFFFFLTSQLRCFEISWKHFGEFHMGSQTINNFGQILSKISPDFVIIKSTFLNLVHGGDFLPFLFINCYNVISLRSFLLCRIPNDNARKSSFLLYNSFKLNQDPWLNTVQIFSVLKALFPLSLRHLFVSTILI